MGSCAPSLVEQGGPQVTSFRDESARSEGCEHPLIPRSQVGVQHGPPSWTRTRLNATAGSAPRSDAHAAAQLCAAGETLIRVHGFDPELAGGLLGETKRTAEAVLGDGFGAACAAGADLDLESAVECALEALVDS